MPQPLFLPTFWPNFREGECNTASTEVTKETKARGEAFSEDDDIWAKKQTEKPQGRCKIQIHRLQKGQTKNQMGLTSQQGVTHAKAPKQRKHNLSRNALHPPGAGEKSWSAPIERAENSKGTAQHRHETKVAPLKLKNQISK